MSDARPDTREIETENQRTPASEGQPPPSRHRTARCRGQFQLRRNRNRPGHRQA